MSNIKLDSSDINAGRDAKMETHNAGRDIHYHHYHYYPNISPSDDPQRGKSPDGFLWSSYAPQILRDACVAGDGAKVMGILDSGNISDINYTDTNNKTLLHLATEAGHTAIVKLLLGHPNINVRIKDSLSLTAFDLALWNGQQDILELFLERSGVYPDPESDDYEDGETALLCASSNGNTMIVKALLKQSSIAINETNRYGNTALMLASYWNHPDIVGLLLGHNNIDSGMQDEDGDTALHLASEKGHLKIVALLLVYDSHSLNVQNRSGNTPLMNACYRGYTEVVKLLLSQPGSRFNARNRDGNTGLTIASMHGHVEVVRLFLIHGGTEMNSIVNAWNNNGDTALSIASGLGYTEVVKLLIEQKSIALQTKNNSGETVLTLASSKRHREIRIALKKEMRYRSKPEVAAAPVRAIGPTSSPGITSQPSRPKNDAIGPPSTPDITTQTSKPKSDAIDAITTPLSGTLSVTILDGRALGVNAVRAYIIMRYGDKEVKTERVGRTTTPEWNQSFTFFVLPMIQQLYLWVYEHRTLGRDKELAEGQIDIWRHTGPGTNSPVDVTVELTTGVIRVRLDFDAAPTNTRRNRSRNSSLRSLAIRSPRLSIDKRLGV